MSGDGARAEPVAPLLVRTGLVLAGLGVAIAIAGHSVDARRWLTADGLRDAVGADEWYGPLGYVVSVVVGMFLPIPKIVLIGLAGVLFGPAWGFLWAWTGQVLGMTALFLVGRTSLRRLARRLVHEHSGFIRRVELHLEHRGIQAVAALRLFYFMGSPLTVMLSTTRLRLRDYVIGTAIGVIPAIALAVVSADAVATGPTAIEAALIGTAIVLVFGLGTVVRRRVGI